MDLSAIRALVVEDDSFERETATTLLRQIGVREVAEACDGRTAWAELCRSDGRGADLVICDLDLPEVDGLELVRRLGERFAATAVILASGHGRAILAAAEAMAESAGVNVLGSLAKPLSRARLYALLRRLNTPTRSAAPPPEEWRAIPLEAIEAGLAGGEFHAFFQPKVALADGRPVGVEALARWVSPRYGVVPPGVFLPRIEDSALIEALSDTMLAQALAALAGWQRAGLSLEVSVNLPARMIARADLAGRLAAALRRAGVTPPRLILEVTETSALTQTALSLGNLARLRLHGFGLSIDDFGTGFSSIQQLSRVPFSELKIDRSFVNRACEQEYLRAIIESSLEMAGKLSLATTAEGVESIGQWRLLHRLGCELAQGYLIARPMPRAQVLAWAEGWSPPAVEVETTRCTVLVIEDEPFQRDVVCGLATGVGFREVASAASLAEARARLAASPVDLLITDLALGDGDGRDLVRALRAGETRSLPGTPVVVLTAQADPEVIAEVFDLEVSGFLAKPVNAVQLEAEIDSALAEPRRTPSPPGAEVPGDGGQVVTSRLWGLVPGMRLVEDVEARDGRVLLRAGFVLTEAVIDRLQDLAGRLRGETFRVQVPK